MLPVARSSSNKCSILPPPCWEGCSALQCNSSKHTRKKITTGQEKKGCPFVEWGQYGFTLPANPSPQLQGRRCSELPQPWVQQEPCAQDLIQGTWFIFSSDTGLEVCELQQFREFNPTKVQAEETERPKVSSHTLISHLSNGTPGCRDTAATFVSPCPQVNIHEKLTYKSQF